MLLESATEKVLDQIDRSLLQVQAHWSRMTEKSFQNIIWKVDVDNLVHMHSCTFMVTVGFGINLK